MNDAPSIVYVVDDDPSIRTALHNLLRSVGLKAEIFASPQEFLDAEEPEGPACIVLDVRFPGRSGLDLQRELAVTNRRLPIIFMSGHGDIPMTVRAMKAGAVDFLPKPFRDQDLLDAIAIALEKDRVRHADQKRVDLLRERLDTLTPREREVLHLVVAGHLNKQIAAALGVSEMTVKIHRRHMMQKMQASRIVELVRIVDQLGLSAQAAGSDR
jgi:FixJ family two-component response regulator